MAKQIIVDVDANTSPFLDKMGEATGKLTKFTEDSVTMGQNISKIGGGIAAGFGIAAGAVGAFGDALGFSAGEIANAQAKATSFISIMTGIGPLMEGAAAGMKLLNAAMAANPIGVLILAITALVAAVVYFAQEEDNAYKATQRLNDALESQAAYTSDVEVIYTRLTKQQIDLAKLRGASETEIAKLEADRNSNLLKYAEDEERVLKQQMANLDALVFRNKDLSEEQETAYKELPDKIKAASVKIKTIHQEMELDVLRVSNAEKAEADENADKYAEAQKKKKEAAAKYGQERLDASRTLKDLEIGLIEDETERSIAATQEQYTRLIEDTKSSETMLQEEKTAIITAAEESRIAAVKVITDQAAAEKVVSDQESYDQLEELRLSLVANEFEQDRITQQQEYDKQMEDLDGFHESKQLSDEEYATLKKAAEQQLSDDIKAINQDEVDFKAELRKVDADNVKSTAITTLNTLGALAGTGSAIGKAAAVAQTTMDTYKAAQGAFSALSGIPIVGPALGAVAAGIAVAGGIANIKKIVAVKLPGTVTLPGGDTPPSIPPTNYVSSIPKPAPPTQAPGFTLFGRGNENGLSTGESATAGAAEPQLIKAVVSETDLVKTNLRLSTIRNASEL